VIVYEVLSPLTNPEHAIDGTHDPIHPDGNIIRRQRIVHGDANATAPIVVEGTYDIGMQDQAFLGTESALAIPDHDGAGIEVFVATQWLHEDRKQMAKCLGLPEEKVRLVLGGVGGAFGAREDISLQVHTALLAMQTSRPVKMQYGREESFFGHVHRHPAQIWMRHHATAAGRIVKIEARFVFDGGAYSSTSSAVLINGVTHTQGPYQCPNAVVDGYAVRTNNPPCGAMRGFGVVQACFAHACRSHECASATSGLSKAQLTRGVDNDANSGWVNPKFFYCYLKGDSVNALSHFGPTMAHFNKSVIAEMNNCTSDFSKSVSEARVL
jgi:CO/xanthine dehydrogenase Mo-binding subunit